MSLSKASAQFQRLTRDLGELVERHERAKGLDSFQKYEDDLPAFAWDKFRVMLEPHGAVGWAALEKYVAEGHEPKLAISIETAHPAKFPEEIQRLLETEPELPPSLAGLDELDEQYEDGPNDYEWFRDWLKKTFG